MTGFLEGFRAPLAAALVAMIVTWALTPAVRKLAIQKGAIDDPKSDERRVHTEPIPRWGGLAIYAGIFVSLLLILPLAYPKEPIPRYLVALIFGGAAIVVVGALDDLYQYKARIQALFLLAVGVAVQFVYSDAGRIQIQGFGTPWGWKDLAWGAIPVTAIYIFVVSKTMDTIDGLDGLAAGIAAIAGATLSVIATYFVLHSPAERAELLGRAYKELPRVALISAALSGASIGFLRHNYNPAKIFMGTGGAQLLGFLLACTSIVGVLKSAAVFALIMPILAFGVPIIDAVTVVIRRVASGQPITQADKRHLHHTLLGKGLTQRQAVLVLYLVAGMLALAALFVASRSV